MALADFAAYLSKVATPSERVSMMGISMTHPTGTRWSSLFALGTRSFNNSGSLTNVTSKPGAVAATCDSTTNGAIGQRNAGSGSLYAWIKNWLMAISGPGTLMMADRLAHVSGLSGTVTTAQAINTPALTRATSGDRVMAAVEIFTAIGGTATTATVSYTNQAGTAGRTSQPIAIGGTNLNGPGTLLPISLQSGDYGIRSVQSITLAGTTGTAGDFGVFLYRPLMMLPINMNTDFGQPGDPLRELGMNLAAIENNACLMFAYHTAGQVILNAAAEIDFMEA